jgi:hypothetical protein
MMLTCRFTIASSDSVLAPTPGGMLESRVAGAGAAVIGDADPPSPDAKGEP